MTVGVYTCESDANVLNKKFKTVAMADAKLKDECTIIDPVLLLSGIKDSDIPFCNYMYIEEFKRYYFIKNITSVRKGLWEVSAHVDVLQSFNSEISAVTGVVKRQQKNYNLYLDDGIFKVYQNPIIKTKAFPSGFSHSNFVLAVAGS